MPFSSTGVITVEWDPKNGYCQCLHPPSKSQLLSASLQGFPRSASGSDPGFFFKVLPLFWDSEHVRFCTHPVRVEFLIYSLPTLPNFSPAGLQSQTFWGLIFLVQDPWAGKPNVELRLLAPWEDLCDYDSLLVCESMTRECGFWLYCLFALPTCLIVFPSLYPQLWEIFFASFHFVLIDICSLSRCNFGVPMRGNEFRVLRFCHLDHTPCHLSLDAQ